MNAKEEAVNHRKADAQTAQTGPAPQSPSSQRQNLRGTSAEPGTSSAAQEKVDRHNLLFGIQLSIRYHSKRQGFFEGSDQISNFVVLLLSSAAVAGFLGGIPDRLRPDAFGVGIAVGIAVITAARIAFRVSSKAAKHAQLVRDYSNLEKDLVGRFDQDEVNSVYKSRLILEAQEPPVLINLSKICHNEVILANNLDKTYILPLDKCQKFWAPLVDLNSYEHKKPTAA